MSNKIDNKTKQAVYDFFLNEQNKSRTAQEFGISPRSVGRIIKAFETEDDNEPTEELKKLMSGEELDECVPNTNSAAAEENPPEEQGVDGNGVYTETVKTIPNGETIVNWTGGLSFISLVLSNGNTISIDGNDERYEQVKEALWKEDLEAALDAADKTTVIREWSKNNIQIKRGQLYVHNKLMKGSVVDHIIQAFENDRPFEKYVNFYMKLLQNPSDNSINQLLPFMKHNDIEVDENGNIIAWKFVRKNYMDCYTGRIRNRVGDEPWMPRNDVVADRNKTCSAGYHVCAKSYLGYGNNHRFMKVLIDPVNVVSVPTDYNGAKMRVCSYKVIEEVTDKWLNNEL